MFCILLYITHLQIYPNETQIPIFFFWLLFMWCNHRVYLLFFFNLFLFVLEKNNQVNTKYKIKQLVKK